MGKEKKKRKHRRSSEDEDERRQRKERKKAEKMLASFGYTNESNPFGDSNLSQPFVWSKKYASRDKKAPSAKELKQEREDRVEEIRRARKRREQREAEQEEMERLRAEELRLKDAEQYQDWQQKEDQFRREQVAVRSRLRIRDRREQPIDLLAKNLLLIIAQKHEIRQGSRKEEDELIKMEGATVEKRSPMSVLQVLSLEELKELDEDHLPEFKELGPDEHGGHAEYWKLVHVILKDRIHKLRKAQKEGRDDGKERGAIHDAVNDSITDMLRGKSVSELRTLRDEVDDTMKRAEDGERGIDIEFWEAVQQEIKVYLARLRLEDLHKQFLHALAPILDRTQPSKPLPRKAPAAKAEVGRDDSSAAKEMEQMEMEKGMDESEERFGAAEEVTVKTDVTWTDKLQPRKPRYFNRVKTGYDWNKYNQTHYDQDNPPPKVVQGYKFNLFYPDLLDKSQAPQFYLQKAHSDDFCILRFSAGPPYQDIAFQIVNQEWERSHKRGFRCVFERGILQLHFDFKRMRYRR